MLEALANAGFETYLGPGDAGLIPLFFGRGGGYYLGLSTYNHCLWTPTHISSRYWGV